MAKVSVVRKDHAHAVGIAIVDAVLVADRAAGLNDSANAGAVC